MDLLNWHQRCVNVSDSSQKNFLFRVCSITAKMFEHRNSGKIRRKRIEFFFEKLPREYKVLIQVKKNSKLSHAWVLLSE
jgi:hypothetical protein